MTYKEAREIVSNAPSKEWLNTNATAQFRYAYLDEPLTIIGILPLLKHVLENDEGWSKFQNPPEAINNSKVFYSNLKDRLTKFLRDIISTQDENWARNQWYYLIEPIQNGSQNAIEYNSPEGTFIQDLYGKLPQAVDGAYQFFVKPSLNSFRDRPYLTGILLAYEFKLQESSELGQRRDKSKRSIAALQNEAENYITESESHLTNFLAEAKQATEQNSLAVSEFQKLKEEEYTTWFTQTKTDFEKFDRETKEWLESQENLYREKLRLEKPAEYWNKRASNLKEEGQTWLKWLSALIGIAAASLFLLLWLIPDGMILNIFKGEASAIKWTIVYITFISFLAFGIKTLSKVTFSAFHLARDAEEREQLAYVYLALKKDGNIDETERHLIMQSLFSRSDTGLLKDDSSPTMPGNIIDKVVNVSK